MGILRRGVLPGRDPQEGEATYYKKWFIQKEAV